MKDLENLNVGNHKNNEEMEKKWNAIQRYILVSIKN